MSLNRRKFLHGATCSICGGLASESSRIQPAAAGGQLFDGCFISPEGYREFTAQRMVYSSVTDGLFARNRHFRTTGDRAVDRDLDRALGVVADLFRVNPAFGFYDPNQFKGKLDDPEHLIMNAFATDELTDIPGTWGTIGFGWDLFRKEFFDFDSTGMTIIAIIAHEFAHNWQQKSGHIRRLRVGSPRKSEINADFLAGYFLGNRKRANPARQFRKAGDLFERLGAQSTGPQRTHGNAKERLDAAEQGFRVAYVERKDLEYALNAGLEYVSLS